MNLEKSRNDYPEIDRKIHEKSFAEKYGGMLFGIVTLVASGSAIYTSFVTKIELIEFKQSQTIEQQKIMLTNIDTMRRELSDLNYDVSSLVEDKERRIEDFNRRISRLEDKLEK